MRERERERALVKNSIQFNARVEEKVEERNLERIWFASERRGQRVL
jgi:hypothetical protein